MEYVRLGSTGLKVSRICLGCMSFGTKQDWQISVEDSRAVVRAALDGGINFFDTANGYGHGESEEILGAALRDFGVDRAESVIATNVGGPAEFIEDGVNGVVLPPRSVDAWAVDYALLEPAAGGE